jgi:hypothetical protein
MPLVLTGAGAITGLTSVPSSGLQLADANMPSGSVLQVVSNTKIDTFSTLSSSFVDVTGLFVTITPTSATSKILVFCTLPIGHGGQRVARANLVRNSTTIAQPTGSATFKATKVAYVYNGDTLTNADFHFLDSPATTSATTYKIQVCTNAGDSLMYVGTRSTYTDLDSVSTITVMEIAA